MSYELKCKNPMVNGLLYKIRAENLGTAFDNELEAIDKHIAEVEAQQKAWEREVDIQRSIRTAELTEEHKKIEREQRRERFVLAALTGLCGALSAGDNTAQDHADRAVKYADATIKKMEEES